jgi:hypothetical protein
MKRLFLFFLCLAIFRGTTACAQAPLTNHVTGANGLSDYIIDGQLDPALTLQRGVTYRFVVSVIGHPFDIKTNRTTLSGDRYNIGVTGQGAQNSTLTFAVPVSAPNLLHYQCESHGAMGGDLNIVDPPTPPPTGQIVDIVVTDTSVTLHSLGATNWNASPEYSSNLNAWAAVVDFTNAFANNTNTTTFNRLDEICGSNVFLRVRNQSN